ncbi:uncharacterized protein [Procambarus clarkii]|uniref:uncharacterized protein n=1 Tax=Procambarus clarkii TaxID=6728 RepID=UPI003743D78C
MATFLHLRGAMAQGRVLRQTSSVFRPGQQLAQMHRSTPVMVLSTPATGTRLDSIPRESPEVTWFHPGDYRVAPMIENNKRGDMIIGLTLVFNSDKPLDQELVYEALTHLYNKTKALRTCLRQHDNRWWYCHMPKPVIDLKVVEAGTNAYKKTEELVKTPFNLADGPLWKVRLVPSPVDAPCLWPEVKEKFPYQNSLLLSLHHALFDGFDMVVLITMLHKFLDDVMSGKPIDDRKIGHLLDHSQTYETTQRVKENLESNPQKLNSLLNDRKSKEFKPLIMQAFGAPEPSSVRTEYFKGAILNLSLLQNFHKKCHSEGITLNSGLVSVINTALVELVREGGLVQDEYTVTSLHPTDLRRYMTTDVKTLPMGFHVAPMSQTMPTPYNVRDHFWKYAKQFDIEFKKNLENKFVFEELILNGMIKPNDKNLLPIKYDYLFTNIYSPKYPNMGVGRHVQLTEMRNIVPIDTSTVGYACGLASLRDKVRYEHWYSTRAMTREIAQRQFEKLLSIFREMAQ